MEPEVSELKSSHVNQNPFSDIEEKVIEKSITMTIVFSLEDISFKLSAYKVQDLFKGVSDCKLINLGELKTWTPDNLSKNVVYYIGHGKNDGDDYPVATEGVSKYDIIGRGKMLKGLDLLVVMDCCNTYPNLTKPIIFEQGSLDKGLLSFKGFNWLSSSGKGESSWYTPGDVTFFTIGMVMTSKGSSSSFDDFTMRLEENMVNIYKLNKKHREGKTVLAKSQLLPPKKVVEQRDVSEAVRILESGVPIRYIMSRYSSEIIQRAMSLIESSKIIMG